MPAMYYEKIMYAYIWSKNGKMLTILGGCLLYYSSPFLTFEMFVIKIESK